MKATSTLKSDPYLCSCWAKGNKEKYLVVNHASTTVWPKFTLSIEIVPIIVLFTSSIFIIYFSKRCWWKLLKDFHLSSSLNFIICYAWNLFFIIIMKFSLKTYSQKKIIFSWKLINLLKAKRKSMTNCMWFNFDKYKEAVYSMRRKNAPNASHPSQFLFMISQRYFLESVTIILYKKWEKCLRWSLIKLLDEIVRNLI